MKTVILCALKFYQKAVSPLFPPSCRFYPSCSQYAIQAVSRFGAFRGGLLAAKRMLKCHPFHPGGIDYVPEVKRKVHD
ncbi:MAG: membrane protein insertion efficiency factor YidD [Oscillospiraceae bacterium]|nr:membrane protein insertion efficiency factor YidD [Oscillospiraceae bacterium]